MSLCTLTFIGLSFIAVQQTEYSSGDAPAASHAALDQSDDAALPRSPDTARWLVHMALHQGHLVGRSDARSASLHVMALLRAAIDADPDCRDAYFWLYDIEQRMGRLDEARRALENYVRLAPGDAIARIRLLDFRLDACQTGEARAELLSSELKAPQLPRAYQSELHAHLARYHHERREVGLAARQIESALLKNPLNIPARRMAYELFAETEPALQRVEMALQLIASNPSQANLVWDLAEFLDRMSLHLHAQEWYNRAIEIHQASGSGPVPPEFWHKLAVSYASAQDYENAVHAATEALNVQPGLHMARLLRSYAQARLGRTADSEADVDFVARAYAARVREAVENRAYDLAAEIAWFYCYHRPDPRRAMQLAEIAMSDPAPSSLARVAYGYALRLNGRRDEAIAALRAQAPVDQLAAYELARALIEAGDIPSAKTVLHKAATLQYSGIAYGLICELMAKHGETPPQPPLNSNVVSALEKFKRDVFDYYRRPWDFLHVSLRPVAQPGIAGPVEIAIRVENIGPFPISFGEGFMARPLVAISATLETPSEDIFENYTQALLNTTPMLLPGERVERTIALDVGPLRNRLIEQAARDVPIHVSAIFDPVYVDGNLTAGLGSINVMPVTIERQALDTTGEGLDAIFSSLRSNDPADRITAADCIGALLATATRDPAAIIGSGTVDRCHAALADLMSDPDWTVRARALAAAGWSPLDPRVTMAAAPLVRRENAITRMLAVRLFAEQHGPKFRKVVETYSKSDGTDYVRLIAASFLPPASRVSFDDSGDEGAARAP